MFTPMDTSLESPNREKQSPKIQKPYLKGIAIQLSKIDSRLKKLEKRSAEGPDFEPMQLKLLTALARADSWVVVGRVIDEANNCVIGVEISLFDRDRHFDQRLGTTYTDQNGEFCLFYRTADFQDLVEAHPDLYLEVLDPQGTTLFTWETPVRCDAGRFERFDIQLKGVNFEA